MMKRLEKVVSVTCIVTAMYVVSIGYVQASPARSLIEKLDTNNDTLISLKEAVRHPPLLRNFGLIDDNEDGKLSEAELANSQLTPGNHKQKATD